MEISDKAVNAIEAVRISIDDIEKCADRYGVSMVTAETLLRLEAATPVVVARALRDIMEGPGGVRVRQRTDYGCHEETVFPRDVLAKAADALDPS